jgi:hypothetical protein
MSTAIVLILAVVCFFIGIIVAYLVQSLREESKSVKAPLQLEGEVEAEMSISTAAPGLSQVPAPADEGVVQESPLTPIGFVEVARFWREESSKLPALEMDGKIFHKPEDMSLSQSEKLEAAIQELSSWLRKPVASELPTFGSDAFLASEVSQPSAFKPPRLSPINVLKNSLDADVRSSLKSAPKSLAAQVDEILQTKLAGSELAERGIRIMDTPSADLVVMVGLEKYDGIDAIEDAGIQGIIREAVAEWGRRATLED